MSKVVLWKPKEIEVLEKYYLIEKIEKIQKRLKIRTKRAIEHKALSLGIRKKSKDVFGSKLWSSQELILMEEKYFLEGAVGMLRFLPFRTQTAIQKKAREIELNVDWENRVVGTRFGRLVVLSRAYKSKPTKGTLFGSWYYNCVCDCDNCVVVCINSLRSGHTKSCGCLKREMLTELRSGENSNFWKGGITELHIAIRTCDKNLKWKKECRERDNYTCQKCNKRGCKTNVHHCQIPFWKILEELIANGITDLKDILDDSEFWDIDNGITLCEDCHKEFHSIYGNDFTVEDFEEWLCSDIRRVV